MVFLVILVLPLALRIRKPLFNAYNKILESREVKTVIYVFGTLIALLLIDSVKNTWKYKTGTSYNPKNYKSSYSYGSDISVKIFYNQRNVYIAGANLFLIIAIPTVFNIIKRLIKYQELAIVKKSDEEIQKEIDELKSQISRADKDITALKSQKKGLERAYDELGDKINAKQSLNGTNDKKFN
ncbi:hypothetical protein WICMUC_005430 [Wickerhamomyces mucosus]|uniref:Endoplasmic reticulum transmembrane protein n=1 Tax=Wickerhamomyces mucosus TaxID=1378264 RepID=A0A9P8T5K1_9ASCO|nr:hypothetical protein WICMUC_005430 [Wickerhamomyces mucosus]